VLTPTAVVELVWQDASGSTAATTYFVLSSSTYAEIDASATAFASILASLTGAVLVKQRIQYKAVPEATSPASSGTTIKRTGIFFFSAGDDTPIALISVPAIKDSKLETSGPREGVGIILSDSDVIAFGDTVIAQGISNPFADIVTGLLDAYLQSRV
jgi:hypothetical protein